MKKKILKTAIIFLLCACVALGVTSFATAESTVDPGTLFESVRDCVITGDYKAPSWADDQSSGILIEGTANNATARYKNVIDVSENGSADVLAKFMVVPAVQHSLDFKKIVIRLTDADDETNYIEVSIYWGQWAGGGGLMVWSYAKGAAGNATHRGMGENGEMTTGYNIGQPINVGFQGDSGAAFMICWDNLSKAFYANGKLVVDLDDPDHVGIGKEWGGFSSGRVYFTISMSVTSNSYAAIMMYELNGNKLGGTKITDVKAPSLNVRMVGNDVAPDAVVGKPYAVFDAKADDEIDGSIEQIDVTLTKPDGTTSALTEKSFTPQAPGKYVLTYTAKDGCDNVAKQTVEIGAFCAMEELSLDMEFEVPSSAKVGEKIYLPTGTPVGGSGKINKEIEVRLGDNVQPIAKDNSFVPTLGGTYIVNYYLSDYLGTEKTLSYALKAEYANAPIAVFPNLPGTVATEVKYQFPDFEATDYTTNKFVSQPANKKIVVLFNGQRTELSENRTFTFGTEGTATVIYHAECVANSAYAVEKSYNVEIKKVNQLSDYFVKDGATMTMTEDSAIISATTDASVQYIYPISATYFDLLFTMSAEKHGAGSVNVILTDSANPNNSVTMKITKRAGANTSYIYVVGEKSQITGSFEGLGNKPFEITFNSANFTLKDYVGSEIIKLTKNDAGEDFKGFSGGKVYVTIEFEDVESETELVLMRLGNQAIYADFDKKGNIKKFEEFAKPQVEPEKDVDLFAAHGSVVTVPSAVGYDVISPYVEVFVEVSDPDGNVIVPETVANREYYFTATKYGLYHVTYKAKDNSYNKATVDYIVNVDDVVPPTIYIQGSVPSSVKVGSEFVLPTVSATDNSGITPSLRQYIMQPDGKLVDVSEKYTFAIKGTYRYYIYAEDSFGTVAYKCYKISVVD